MIEYGSITQEIADKLNISVAALSRYETGSFEPKSIALIVDFIMKSKMEDMFIYQVKDAVRQQ